MYLLCSQLIDMAFGNESSSSDKDHDAAQMDADDERRLIDSLIASTSVGTPGCDDADASVKADFATEK